VRLVRLEFFKREAERRELPVIRSSTRLEVAEVLLYGQ